MRDRGPNDLPEPLSRAVRLLREEPEVRRAWRDQLLEEIEKPVAPVGMRPARRISLSPAMAIAAAFVFMVLGAGAAVVVSRDTFSPQVTPAATMTASAVNPASPAALASGSAASMALPVRFSFVAPGAANVSIVGDFNHWNPATLPMKRSADGRTWEVEVRLPLGRYSYAFMIDGRLAPDPKAPRGSGDDFGTPNSVLMVHGT